MTSAYDISCSAASDAVVSERKLITFSQQGDQDAFASLYDAYLERIHRYVFFRVFDPDVAEDITSLVFLRVWENLDTFQCGRSAFAAWIYRIAHNAIVDYFRRRKTVVSLEDVHPLKLSYTDEVDERVDRKIRSQELAQALKELTGLQREVLTLRFIFGMTISETSVRLKKRQGSIRALQFRALRRLGSILPAGENAQRSRHLA
jgi:RNA polymerase sigma-70 factor (ECF subfamily)